MSFEQQDEPAMLIKLSDGRRFVRTGSCQPDCGACCEFMKLPLDPRVETMPEYNDYVHWAELHGVEIYKQGDRLIAKIPLKCNELAEDKSCKVFGTSSRPTMCSHYPRTSNELEEVADVCSYKVREIV